MDFLEQYKDPRWKERKNEYIYHRFRGDAPYCEMCFVMGLISHLHHIRYFKNRMIWEYEDKYLLLLCKECHKLVHVIQDDIKEIIAEITSKPHIMEQFVDVLRAISNLDQQEMYIAIKLLPKIHKYIDA